MFCKSIAIVQYYGILYMQLRLIGKETKNMNFNN